MKEIKEKNTDDLKKFIAEKREELRTIRFNASGSGMRNTQATKNMKKEVARSLTELNTRAREAAKKA